MTKKGFKEGNFKLNIREKRVQNVYKANLI